MQESKAAREANYAHGLGGEYFFERESRNSLVNEGEKEGVFEKPPGSLCKGESFSSFHLSFHTSLYRWTSWVSLRTLMPF